MKISDLAVDHRVSVYVLIAILIAVGVWLLYSHGVGMLPDNGRWRMPHHGMMGGGMGIVMIIFWVVLVGAVALLISGAVNGLRASKPNDGGSPDALEILNRRYARGEIDQTEYEHKRQDLTA